MAVHNSHYGLIQDNVAWNYNGFLCGTEDGSKSYNVFDQNFAVRSNGSGGAWPGSTLNTIGMFWDPTHPSSTNTTQRDELFVYDYQGQVGNNFRVYYLEQATQNIAGGPGPCNDTVTRPEIRGITCPIGGGATVPAAPSVLRVQ